MSSAMNERWLCVCSHHVCIGNWNEPSSELACVHVNILTQLVLHFVYTTHSIFRMRFVRYISLSPGFFVVILLLLLFILTHFVRFAYSITIELFFFSLWFQFTSKPMSVNCSTIFEVVDLGASKLFSFHKQFSSICHMNISATVVKIATSFVWGDFCCCFDICLFL